MTGETGGAVSRFRVRSYELDGFGHANHAVFLNWLEQARFEALEAGGFPIDGLVARGWSVVVVRVEIDYRKEALLGQDLVVRTAVHSVRKTSMILRQVVVRPGTEGDTVLAEALVTAVWLENGRPMRVPPEVRAALDVDAPTPPPPDTGDRDVQPRQE